MSSIKQLVARKSLILLSVLVIFHLVGLVGMLLPAYRNQILSLSFMNLMLSFVVLILSRKHQGLNFYLFIILCFVLGMGYELIGVHTGYLFGDYHYGTNLGAKFHGVPYIIGINWFVLAFTSCSLTRLLHVPNWMKSVLASVLMTLMDFLIEPIAITSGYWTWENGEIPLFNYLCWFFLSLPLTFFYFKLKISEQNKVAIGLYFIFVLFFGILNLAQ